MKQLLRVLCAMILTLSIISVVTIVGMTVKAITIIWMDHNPVSFLVAMILLGITVFSLLFYFGYSLFDWT